MVNCLIEIDVATGQDELQKPIYLNPSIVLGDHAIKPVPNLRRTACIRYSLEHRTGNRTLRLLRGLEL